ncbi:hypothetical protein [Nannocystis radixulma]|uniref:Uncharacterized protein n=1 Tax=Nannocystis radixulma TaxID=2995305 RepID=A0ABT5BND4_9BACT|nr:hypothetical protein [Nannocystis radixulma]MDC0675612.1 hypothetical protein [Nannocystis radixulma]
MRSYSFSCLSLVFAVALACDSKGNGSGSDTSNIDSSTTDDGGTDGVSSTGGGSGPEPATTTASPATGEPDTATSTSGYDPTATTGADPTATATGTSTTVDPDPTGMTTVNPATSDTDEPPPPEPTPCEGEAVVLDVATLAYTQGQIPPEPDPTGESSSGGTGGDPVDPDTLYVRLSNQVATCADPNAGIECGNNWEVTIRIPTAFQTPGLYHLAGTDVTGTAMETGPEDEPDLCAFGGGTFSASFELIAVDGQEVVGRLCHVDWPFFDNNVNLEGSFTAQRCQ